MISHSRAIRSKSQKNVKFAKFGPLIYLNCESTCDLTDVQASIYDRKMDAQSFDTIDDIQRFFSLLQSLLESRNARIGRKLEPLSGIDGLNSKRYF